MVQMALGMMGFFVIHPKQPENPPPTATSASSAHVGDRSDTATPNPPSCSISPVHLQRPRLAGHRTDDLPFERPVRIRIAISR